MNSVYVSGERISKICGGLDGGQEMRERKEMRMALQFLAEETG